MICEFGFCGGQETTKKKQTQADNAWLGNFKGYALAEPVVCQLKRELWYFAVRSGLLWN